MSTLTVHPARFDWPEDFDPAWNPLYPDLALVANAVSLLMPYVEPYVVDSVRTVIDQLEPPLRSEADAYARQEAQHHGQHRRFNRKMAASFVGVKQLEAVMSRTFEALGRRSPAFGLAFAAGFEGVAYSAARWVADRKQLLDGADPTARSLFLWHLAEEVEHKSVAIEVYRSVCSNETSRRRTLRYGAATILSLVLLAAFSAIAWLLLATQSGRWYRPTAWIRVIWWSLTFFFTAMPTLAASIGESHHPDQLVDPLFYELWLDDFRGTEPASELAGSTPDGIDPVRSGHGSRPVQSGDVCPGDAVG